MSVERGGLLPVCILAGGMGTRLGEVAGSTPKSLVEVAGAPFIHHQLRLLARHGADRVVLCVGHLGELIERSAGDGGDFGLSISYSHDPPGLAGTAGAVRGALPQLGDSFLVLYGDTYLRIDYADFAASFLRSGLPAQMAVLRNEGRWNPSNTDFDDKLVVRHQKGDPDSAMEWIDYGLGAFRAEVFNSGAGARAADLAEVYSELAAESRLGGYVAERRFYEIGTPEALAETDSFLRSRSEGS
jgi:NDP-sugar pyrophosphorylase family protein